MLCVDSFKKGNETRMINDYRDQSGRKTATRQQNVMYHQQLVNGWPHVFIVATEDIPADTELLVDYGAAFWTTLKGLIEEHKQVTRGLVVVLTAVVVVVVSCEG